MNSALLDLMAEALAVAPAAKRLLVSHYNDASVLGALHGQYSSVWARSAGQEKATAWPEGGPYEEILLPLPRGKESLRLCLHAVTSVLKPGGRVWLFGQNDLGIKSADKPLAEFFENVDSAGTGGHGRIWRAQSMKPDVSQPLEMLRREEAFILPGGVLRLCSYPGLFAGGTLDEGTAVLLESLPEVPQTVLDFACGIGVVAAAAYQKNKDAVITVADNDPLALLASSQNLPGVQTQLTALPTDLTGTFDLILSNPPIHQGDVQSFQIVDLLIRELPRLLKPKGAAYLVAQVTVPIARLASIHKMKCAEVASSRSFRVWALTR